MLDLYSTDFTPQPQQQPGLLTSNVLPNVGQQFKDASLNAAQSPTTNETPQVNILDKGTANIGYQAPQTLQQQQVTTAAPSAPQTPQTWQQKEADYKKAYYAKLKSLYQNKDIDNKTINQVLPQLNTMFNDQLTQAKSQYTQQQTNSLLNTLNDKTNYKNAAVAAARLAQLGVKIPSGFVAAFKDPELKHVIVNAGGTMELKSFNPTTGEFTDGGSVTVTNTPYQEGQLAIGQQNADANTTRAQASMISATKPPRTTGNGGITASQQRAISDKLAAAKAIMSAYDPNGKPDGMGGYKPYTTAEQINFNMAAEYIKAYDSNWNSDEPQAQPQQQSSGDDSGAAYYDRTFREIKAAHPEASDDEIYEFMTQMINGR
jgi:hypothetical protein